MKKEKKSCRKKALFEPRQKIYGKNHRIKSNLLKSLMYIVHVKILLMTKFITCNNQTIKTFYQQLQ